MFQCMLTQKNVPSPVWYQKATSNMDYLGLLATMATCYSEQALKLQAWAACLLPLLTTSG